MDQGKTEAGRQASLFRREEGIEGAPANFLRHSRAVVTHADAHDARVIERLRANGHRSLPAGRLAGIDHEVEHGLGQPVRRHGQGREIVGDVPLQGRPRGNRGVDERLDLFGPRGDRGDGIGGVLVIGIERQETKAVAEVLKVVHALAQRRHLVPSFLGKLLGFQGVELAADGKQYVVHVVAEPRGESSHRRETLGQTQLRVRRLQLRGAGLHELLEVVAVTRQLGPAAA